MSNKNYLKKRFTIVYFFLLFILLVAIFYPSFSNPPLSDSWEMFYTFHHLDEKPGPIKWLHVLNHDPYEQMRYQPLSHMFYYIFHLVFGSNYYIYNILNFLFYFLSLLVLYKFALYFLKGYKIAALFIGLFAFLFSHCDIVLWNCHIYIIAGFISFLIGFMKYMDFLRTGKKELLFFTLFFFLFGMLCYESFWAWPFAIIIISSMDKFKEFWQKKKKKLLKINSLFLGAIYTLYILIFFLTRLIGTYDKPAHSISDFLKFGGFIKAGLLSFFSIIYNNLAVNIFPLLSFPLRIEENLYLGGSIINNIDSGNRLIIYLLGGLVAILIFSLFIFLYRKKYFELTKITLFLFFLLFSEIYTIIFFRLVTNTSVTYSLIEPRYHYIPNAFIIIFIAILISRSNIFKNNKHNKIMLIFSLLIVFGINVFCVHKVVNIYQRNLKDFKRMFKNIRVGMAKGHINKSRKLFFPEDLSDYLPSLCWNIDMGSRFMDGTYQWLFSKEENEYFANSIKQSFWTIDKGNFNIINKNSPAVSKNYQKIVKGKGRTSLDIGYFYLNKKEYKKAEFMFKAAVADLENYKAYMGLGRLYNTLKKYDSADKAFRTVLNINPHCTDTYLELGHIYRDRMRYEKSEKMYKKAIKLNPEDVRAYLGLWNIYDNQGRYKEAKSVFDKVMKLKLMGK
ncbi:MAG: tetratricopeptide repeat protein [Candidatus Omnitrophica bacterium]|nr:tetratricopeptide repeat protein [Candidatus Omnitrophota bacterium]